MKSLSLSYVGVLLHEGPPRHEVLTESSRTAPILGFVLPDGLIDWAAFPRALVGIGAQAAGKACSEWVLVLVVPPRDD